MLEIAELIETLMGIALFVVLIIFALRVIAELFGTNDDHDR